MPTPVPVTSPEVIVKPTVQSRFRNNFRPWKQANSIINFTQVTSCRHYGRNKASYHDKYTKRSFRWSKYCRLPLYHSRSPQYRTKAGGTKPQLWSNYEQLKDLPYLTLTGEPWAVFSGLFGKNRSRNMESVNWKNFAENWSHYNGLYCIQGAGISTCCSAAMAAMPSTEMITLGKLSGLLMSHSHQGL